MLIKKKRFTLQVSEKTHNDLVRILSRLQLSDGKLRNFDDVVIELIKTWLDAKGVALED